MLTEHFLDITLHVSDPDDHKFKFSELNSTRCDRSVRLDVRIDNYSFPSLYIISTLM